MSRLGGKTEYQPSELRIKIYLMFEKIHMVNAVKSVLKAIRKIRNTVGVPSKYMSAEEREFIKAYDTYAESILDLKNNRDVSNLAIISGYISTFEKGGNRFFKQLGEQIPQLNWVVISQSGKEITDQERRKIAFDTIAMPKVPFKGGYDTDSSFNCSPEMLKTISQKEYLNDAVCNIKSYHDDMGEGYPEALVYYTYHTTKLLIENLKPSVVIVHNKLYSLHEIMIEVCREYNIRTLYFEFGALPGTFVLEEKGQMGASWVSADYDKFNALPISQNDLEAAKKVCTFMKESGINRNRQIKVSIRDEIYKRIKADRPIILYAGQNDFDSGIVPYNEYAKQFHSPVFAGSDEAAIYLAEIAKKNDWNLIYKPHPLAVKHGRCLEAGLPENIIWINEADINEIIDLSDVVVTILSQVGDVALIREKPTVMLGYTQLRRKGCCYEAYKLEDIEPHILEAIKQGYTEKQKRNFIRYVARSLKYYLFDDLNTRALRFGRDIRECGKYLSERVDHKEKENTELPYIKEKFVFEESPFFHKRIICNELDFLDILGEIAGRENICVKVYDESSCKRFEMRGYKTFYMEQRQWEYALKSGALSGKGLIAMYPMHGFSYIAGADEVYSFDLYVGRKEMLNKENPFEFSAAYRQSKIRSENVILYPQDIEEYEIFIKYLQEKS